MSSQTGEGLGPRQSGGAAPSRALTHRCARLPTPRPGSDAKKVLERVRTRLLWLHLRVLAPGDDLGAAAAAGRLSGEAVMLQQMPGWQQRSSSKQGWGVLGILLPAGSRAEEF